MLISYAAFSLPKGPQTHSLAMTKQDPANPFLDDGPETPRRDAARPPYDQTPADDTRLCWTPIRGRQAEGEKEVDVSTIATSATSTFEISSTLLDDPSFVPGRTMHIQATGVRLVRFPSRDQEMEIEICSEQGLPSYHHWLRLQTPMAPLPTLQLSCCRPNATHCSLVLPKDHLSYPVTLRPPVVP